MTRVLDIQPIGFIESPFDTKNGTPRQPQLVRSARCRLKLSHSRLPHPEHALEGLSDYSHVWILFYFHQDASVERVSEPVKSKVTPPKLGGQKCGLFATRTPQRPNAIGLSLVEVERVEHDVLHLRGADLIDGTPVLDVKPFLPHIDKPRSVNGEAKASEIEALIPAWLASTVDTEEPLHVAYTGRAQCMLTKIFEDERSVESHYKTMDSFQAFLGEILAGDPRSLYRKDKCSDRLYFLELDGLHVTAWFDEDEQGNELAEVLRVRVLYRFSNTSKL